MILTTSVDITTIRLNCFMIHLRSVTHKKILLTFAEGSDDQHISQTTVNELNMLSSLDTGYIEKAYFKVVRN